MPGQARAGQNEDQHDDAQQLHAVGHEVRRDRPAQVFPERVDQDPKAEADEEGRKGVGGIPELSRRLLGRRFVAEGDDKLRAVRVPDKGAGQDEDVSLSGGGHVGHLFYRRLALVVQGRKDGVVEALVAAAVAQKRKACARLPVALVHLQHAGSGTVDVDDIALAVEHQDRVVHIAQDLL